VLQCYSLLLCVVGRLCKCIYIYILKAPVQSVYFWQFLAVCYGLLQGVAVCCCRMLQCIGAMSQFVVVFYCETQWCEVDRIEILLCKCACFRHTCVSCRMFHYVEKYVAGCGRVVQGVAGCCRVLQGVAGCCRVLQGAAGCCKMLQSVAAVSG